MRSRMLVLAVAAWAGLGVAPVRAQDFPTRPLMLVLGFAAGGPSDVMARIFAKKLEQVIAQPVVIENRAGAGGNVAAEHVARATPDGHTLLLANSGILAANAALYAKVNFDPIKDFAPITLIGAQANVLLVHPSVPARTLPEFIAYARANPGKLSYSSGGNGTSPHLAAELLKAEAGINMVHVPYRGTGPALQDLLAGHVQLNFSSVSPVIGHIRSGTLHALGVSALKRTALLPDIPTIAESGIPGYEATAWHALVVTGGTPKAAVATLHRAMMTTLSDPDTRSALTKLGVDVGGNTPDEMAAYIKSEIPKWSALIKATGAKIQ